LPVPTNGWINDGWNKKLSQFHLLAEMLGLKKPSISPDELQELFKKVGSAKVFADNVQPFLEESRWPLNAVYERLEEIESKLGLMDPLPFMSLKGWMDPQLFSGVAIWPAGITNWTQLRLEQILLAKNAGANFDHVVVMWSSRKCNQPADRRHPAINWFYEEGKEPTERKLQQDLLKRLGSSKGTLKFEFAQLPRAEAESRPLSLQKQLEHLVATGQFDELIGDRKVYVPSTPNSLYVPLHVKRVLGLENVWFSQAGARLVREMTDYWWPSLQEVLTTPNGIIRLWVELIHAGCIKT
jgi:hypothetical protein